jgi:hypothetical protein
MGEVGGNGRLSRIVRLLGLGAMCLALANCASSNTSSRVERTSRATATADAQSSRHVRTAHGRIDCDERGCSDRGNASRAAIARASYASLDDGMVVGRRPEECPASFCGCEASRYVFGKVRPELNLASNWMRFPRAAPAPGMVAVRNHHVMVLMSHAGGNEWLVHDGNSGGRLTREHVMPISRYVVVNPNGS